MHVKKIPWAEKGLEIREFKIHLLKIRVISTDTKPFVTSISHHSSNSIVEVYLSLVDEENPYVT